MMTQSMPLRYTLILLGLGSLISLLGAIGLIVFVNPGHAAWWIVAALYLLIFFCAVGGFWILGTVVRVKVLKADVPVRQFTRSVRQGVFLGALVVVALFLAHIELLNAWSLALLIIGIAFLELFFLTSRSRAT